MKHSEISNYWFKEGIRFICAYPDRTLELFLRKAAMFWNPFEIPDNYNYYFVRDHVWILQVLFVGFGMVAPLGFFGLFLARRSPGTWLFILFTIGYMISIVISHVASRYRLPVVPVLIVFAGHTVARACEALRARRFGRLALGLVPVAALAVFVKATDVGNAMLDGTDALMLSAETAIGKYPADTIAVMSAIAMRTEQAWLHGELPGPDELPSRLNIDANIAYASHVVGPVHYR